MASRPTLTVQSQTCGVLTGFINDLPLPCRRVKKQFQVIRVRPVHSLKVFQLSPAVNCHHSAATRRVSRKM